MLYGTHWNGLFLHAGVGGEVHGTCISNAVWAAVDLLLELDQDTIIVQTEKMVCLMRLSCVMLKKIVVIAI